MGYFALDIGSSFIKYAVLDIENRQIRGKGKTAMPSPVSGRATRYEIRAEEIWNIVEMLTEQILRKEKVLDGILLCTQMQGVVILDENAEAVTSYISWQDNRCLECHDGKTWLQEMEDMGCDRLMEHSGVRLRAGLGMCNLYVTLREIQGGAEGRWFCTLGSYIIRKMTGNHICHITNGAATGLADIVERQWNHPLIEKIGAGRLRFPELALEMECCGYYESEGNRIPVYPDIGDHQACVLGSMVRPEQDVNINIGTAGLLGIVTDAYWQGEGEVRPYFGNQYLNTVRGLCGGRDLKCIAGFIKDSVEAVTGQKVRPKEIWDVIGRIPEREGSDALEIEPEFYQGGRIAGITHGNFTLNSLLDAVYRQMGRQYHRALMSVLPTGNRVSRIVYSGGAATSNQGLMMRIAEETGCRWQRALMEDESLLGLYRMALLISGRCKTMEETSALAQNIEIVKEISGLT